MLDCFGRLYKGNEGIQVLKTSFGLIRINDRSIIPKARSIINIVNAEYPANILGEHLKDLFHNGLSRARLLQDLNDEIFPQHKAGIQQSLIVIE